MYQKENISNELQETVKKRKIYITNIFINYSTLLMNALGIKQVNKM